MKKSGSKRAAYDSGLSSAVLDAPEESFALKGATVSGGWLGRGPAPTGALQRGYGEPDLDTGYGAPSLDEPEYVPRRGSFRLRLGGIPKSLTGRIVLGVVVFLALSAVTLTVGGVRYYLMHDARFLMATSADIQILGDEHLSRPEVLSVFAGDLERNIFRVPLAQRRADLERLPWVKHATVMRLLPNKIRVSITERTPVAFVRQGTQIGLVDASGVLLDMPPEAAGDPHYSFPVLTGVSAGDPLSTRAARMEIYRQFMQDLDSTGEKLTNSLSEVDVSNPEDVKALVASGSSDVLVHFGDEAFLTRYKEFEQHLPEWKQQYPKLASADMRYEGQIVLEMLGGAGVPVSGEPATAPVDAAETKAAPTAAVTAPVASAPVANVVKPKPVVAKAPVVKPVAVDLGVAKPKGIAEAVPVDLGSAKPAAAKAAVKPKPAAVKPVGKKAAKPVTKGKGAKSASNEKMFAALAAAQKARAAKSGGDGMNASTDNLITVLDAGSQKSVVLVAEVVDRALRYRGHGIEVSRGMRRGVIADLGPAAKAINAAALTAERSTKAPIETAVVGIGGPHIRGMNSQGGISMGSRMKEITREDVRSAIDRARSVGLAPDREVLHLLPQQFILDDQGGIHDPVGMVGNRLEVCLHLSTCSGSASQSVVTCANRAGLEVVDTVFEGIAAAEAVLSADERELGVCVADIGASSTELVVYFEGSVAHTAVLPIGGDHFTNDLAVGLHVSVEEAEQLKRMYGNCVVTAVPQLNEIEIGGDLATGGQAARLVRQRFLAEILEPRARELVTMLRDNLRTGGVLEAMGAGCVFTGGGSQLVGLLDNAESILRVPARMKSPVRLSKMPAELAKPEFATAIGMLLYTHRTQALKASEEQGLAQKLKSIFAGSF